jgi:hypothetical protein
LRCRLLTRALILADGSLPLPLGRLPALPRSSLRLPATGSKPAARRTAATGEAPPATTTTRLRGPTAPPAASFRSRLTDKTQNENARNECHPDTMP